MMTRMEKYKDLREEIAKENKEIKEILEARDSYKQNVEDLDECIFGHLVTFRDEQDLEDFREESIKSLLNDLADNLGGIIV